MKNNSIIYTETNSKIRIIIKYNNTKKEKISIYKKINKILEQGYKIDYVSGDLESIYLDYKLDTPINFNIINRE